MPKKAPHPRSVAALYGPKPRTIRKAPVKLCSAGHRQRNLWKPGNYCVQCAVAQNVEKMAGAARLEREEWHARNGLAPAFLTIKVVDTGKVIRYTIPKHLQRRRARV